MVKPISSSREPLPGPRAGAAAEDWHASKATADGAGQLWRVHNKLYDLAAFESPHPGGAQWIAFPRGTDCTEAFERRHRKHRAAMLH